MSTDTAQAAAPPSQETSSGKRAPTGSKAALFARRRQQTRRVKLPGDEHPDPYLLVALRPIEVQEINTYCLEQHPDPKDPKKTIQRYSPMRPFYLIARSLYESDGKPMFPANAAGEQAAWLYGGQQVANFLTTKESNLLFDAVAELNGFGEDQDEVAEKNSSRTANASS